MNILGGLASFAAGLLVAFFSAGVGLFADGEFIERLPTLGVAFVGYMVIGMVGGVAAPAHRWPAVAGASGVLPVVILFGEFGIASMVLLAVAFVVLSYAGALLGHAAGSAIARSHRIERDGS